MYAPVATRFLTYDVQLDEVSAAYFQTIMPCQNCRSGSQPPGRNPTRSTSWTSSFEPHATELLRPRQNTAAVRPPACRVSRSWGRRVAPGSRIDSFVSRNTSATPDEYRQTKPGSWAPHARLPQSLMAHDVRDFRHLPFRCGRGDLASCVRRNHGSSSGAERAIRGGILAGIVLAQMARR
jgi:hypothetical protein